MATNGNKTEDADMADSDGEKVVTMMDVLQEQQEFEEDANAVLGASDDKNCTYTKGYIKRQAIYACLTCCFESKDDPSKRAGVCLACSLTCHENHELIELYTKRHFRCDCGNPKFNSHPCQYTPNKDDINEENKYNQNFSGLYCVCHRPYPDPEIPEEDEMIQCIICEDWLHSSHLEAMVPSNDQYSEMICKACMETNIFLHDYSKFAVNVENEDVEITVNGTDYLHEKVVNGTGDIPVTEGKEMDSSTQEETEVPSTVQEDNEATVQENNEDKKVDNNEELMPTIENNKGEAIEGALDNKNSVSKISETELTKIDANMDAENRIETEPVKDETNMNSDQVESKTDSSESEKTSEITMDNSNENKSGEHEKENISSDKTLNDDKTVESVSSETIGDVKVNSSELPETETTNIESMNDELEPKQVINIQESSQIEPHNTEKMDMDDSDASSKVPDETKADQDSCNNESNVTVKENEKTNESTKSDSSITNDIEINDKSIDKSDNNANDDSNSHKNSHENKRKLSTEEAIENSASKKQKIEGVCIRPKGVKKIYKGATFWPSDFRQKLCTCNECLSMYKALSVLYLIDPEDTVTAYETLGMEKDGTPASQYEKGLEALSSLDRVQQINALTEYNKMKDKLLDFLKSFKDRKEIVKEEDIKAFFAGMKPKREPDGVYFCR